MTAHQGPVDPWVTLALRQVPTAARLARSSLRSALAAVGLDRDVVADAELVMNELVANAVEHGLPDADGMIEAAWRVTADRLLVRVRDSGTAPGLEPGTLEHGPEGPRPRGRGLAIVAMLASTWSYEADGNGTEVTAVLMRTRRS